MLTLWIIGSAVSVSSVLYSFTGRATAYAVLGHPDWAILPLGFLSLVNLVCVLAIWNWKRWGMYGLAGSATAFFIITLISLSFFVALITIVGVVIIGFLVRPVWNQMD